MKRLLFICITLLWWLCRQQKWVMTGCTKHWMRETFKDLAEDLVEANSEGKRLAVIIEQQNCMYCKKMHETVFSDPDIFSYIMDNFFVVQINMFGNVEVTDFNGETLEERDMVSKWGMLFTPTMMFFPEDVSDEQTANQVLCLYAWIFGKRRQETFLHGSWIRI